MKRIIVALGGNALGHNPEEQQKLVQKTASSLAPLIASQDQIIIAHGNGPQVGMINLAFELGNRFDKAISNMPFPECGAMSQGYIGYHLQNALNNELLKLNIKKNIATIITQVEVDSSDPAFTNPTKPIGAFYSAEEASSIALEKNYIMKEDAGRGYRRVVPSPKPIGVVEVETIKKLMEAGHTVITIGGGGIPVVKREGIYRGVDAVIDKDYAAACLGKLLDADVLIILTAVNKIALNYRTPNQIDLDSFTVSEAKKYLEEGHFLKGSMGPKVEAALDFVQEKAGRLAIIAALDEVEAALKGQAGTKISN